MPSPTPSPTHDATSTRRGLMGITAQTFSGIKTFLDAVKLAFRATADLPVGGAELEGHLMYDSTLKRPQVHDGTGWKSVVVSLSGVDATSLEEHLTSTSAHPATSITYGATNAEAALDSLSAVKMTSSTLAATGGAALVGATPSGNLASTTAQAQLYELDSEKVSSSVLATTGGAALVGAAAQAGTPTSLIAGTTQGQLNALLAAINQRVEVVDTTVTILNTNGGGGTAMGTGFSCITLPPSTEVNKLRFWKGTATTGHIQGAFNTDGNHSLIYTFPGGWLPASTVYHEVVSTTGSRATLVLSASTGNLSLIDSPSGFFNGAAGIYYVSLTYRM